MSYPDFTATASGLQYKDNTEGTGDAANIGDRVVISWEGYTIGYYGRAFEKKNSVKGGAFEADQDSFRFVIGRHTVIAGLEEGVLGMRVGGVRQIVVPPELGYPSSDRDHVLMGPKPSTFSGQRALDFVLTNQGMIDKTLLFNVAVKRIDKPGERGFKG
jgi:FKBP-type peptidyl-prolyl cis-trans isomerase